jgi:Spy/CpxP family protein refolding chaperone
MNKSVKMILAAATVIALSASAYARDGEGCGFGEHGMDMAKIEKMHAQHLAKLHDKLKLTAQQEGAWKKFAAASTPPNKEARPDPAELDKLTAPQRLEKGLEHMKAMETKLGEHLAALKEFYATLTPEQQKTFDEQTTHHGMHGEMHGQKQDK